jgi:AcrR family transcriptional regulator
MEKKKKKVPTRQLLLETAGELFAENGMKGTSIKMIADRSKQNIAAANYHFGSKKNLFIETLKFVVDKLTANSNTKPGKISAKNFNSELASSQQINSNLVWRINCQSISRSTQACSGIGPRILQPRSRLP